MRLLIIPNMDALTLDVSICAAMKKSRDNKAFDPDPFDRQSRNDDYDGVGCKRSRAG